MAFKTSTADREIIGVPRAGVVIFLTTFSLFKALANKINDNAHRVPFALTVVL